MNENARRLFGRIRNDLRALGHTRRDRAQVKLLEDLRKTLSVLELEVCNTTLKKEELNMSHKPAGGLKSKNVTETRVRTGSGSKGTRPAGVAQLGNSQGSHVTRQGDTGYRGEVFHKPPNFQPTPFGNEVAASTQCGVGGSRTIYKTGTQGQQGQVAGSPRPAGRKILNEFGPNKRS